MAFLSTEVEYRRHEGGADTKEAGVGFTMASRKGDISFPDQNIRRSFLRLIATALVKRPHATKGLVRHLPFVPVPSSPTDVERWPDETTASMAGFKAYHG